MIAHKSMRLTCVAALIGLISLPTMAQQKHKHVHEHGKGNLEITIDKNRVMSRFTSPLEALVGFERQPKTPAEQDAIAALNQRLLNPASLFSVNAEAECKATILENKIVRDAANKHADLHYQLEFMCAKPAAVKQMTIHLFKDHRHLKEVRVEWVGPSGQKSTMATAKANTVTLN